jgi:hypothetical protein
MEFITQNSGLIVSLLFFGMFSLIAIWSYLPRNKERLQGYAYIPLNPVGDEVAAQDPAHPLRVSQDSRRKP